MGITVKTTPIEVKPLPPTATEPLPPLTITELQQHWQAMVQAMQKDLPQLSEQVKDRELRVDGDDHFIVVVPNNYVETEIKTHLIRMLTYLRNRSGRQDLNCHVVVEYEEHETVAYTPRDKYDVMSEANPNLETLRIILPEVDY